MTKCHVAQFSGSQFKVHVHCRHIKIFMKCERRTSSKFSSPQIIIKKDGLTVIENTFHQYSKMNISSDTKLDVRCIETWAKPLDMKSSKDHAYKCLEETEIAGDTFTFYAF